MAILISILAIYAVTIMLTETDGPYDMFSKLRSNKYMGALNCITCTAMWVAPFIALYPANNLVEWVIITFALVGGATAIDRINT